MSPTQRLRTYSINDRIRPFNYRRGYTIVRREKVAPRAYETARNRHCGVTSGGWDIIINNSSLIMESYFQKFTRTINKWIGKSVDYDKAYWSQCVDFARQYCADLWTPIGTFSGSAFKWWQTGSPFNVRWERIIRYENFPSAWSVVFFAPTKNNPYGHVAIADNGCTETVLKIIEQNAGSWNWDWKWNNTIRKRTTNYKNCLGWYTHF